MFVSKHFGQIVRTKRENKRMTLQALAEECDMSIKGIEHIELGDSDPKLTNVLKIAKILEIDLGELNHCAVSKNQSKSNNNT